MLQHIPLTNHDNDANFIIFSVGFIIHPRKQARKKSVHCPATDGRDQTSHSLHLSANFQTGKIHTLKFHFAVTPHDMTKAPCTYERQLHIGQAVHGQLVH